MASPFIHNTPPHAHPFTFFPRRPARRSTRPAATRPGLLKSIDDLFSFSSSLQTPDSRLLFCPPCPLCPLCPLQPFPHPSPQTAHPATRSTLRPLGPFRPLPNSPNSFSPHAPNPLANPQSAIRNPQLLDTLPKNWVLFQVVRTLFKGRANTVEYVAGWPNW